MIKRSLTLLLILGMTLTLSCSQTKKTRAKKSPLKEGELNLDVTKVTLDNGLIVLISENHKLPIFSYYTYYKVGGKYETEGFTGATHYLEHMMFKGAKKYGPGEFDRLVEGNGGSNNAFTTNDHTVYYENLPSKHIEKIIDLEADRMQNLLLEEQSFERERQVILEERRMRYENSDRGKLYLGMMKRMFEGTPYGTSVIGKIPDLKSVTRKQMYDYFKLHYAPNNAIVVIVGDVDTDETIKMIKKYYGPMKASPESEKKKADQLKKLGFDFKAKYNKTFRLKGQTPNPMFMLSFKGTKVGTDDSYVLDILGSILGGGASSYLSQKYVLGKNPTLSNVYASNYTLQDSGVFFIGGELLSKKSIVATRNSLYKSLKKSCAEAITQRSLDKVKNQYLVDMFSSLDTNAGVARFIGDSEFYYGDYSFYNQEMKNYQNVTVEALKVACQKYIKRENSHFLSIWNKN